MHNPKVQAVRKLQSQARERHLQQAFVVEGVRLCEEALKAGWNTRQVFFTDLLDERGKSVVDGFAGRSAPVETVSQAVMEALSETETPQGLLVVVDQQILPLPPAPDFLLILDGLRDPGNLGSILRTARAAGVQGVLLAPGCVDAWSGKVLRSGMGAHFHLPIHSLHWPDIQGIVK
ncbi:MAG TPA: RNA methyltransferase, partial [Anaerolineales bacterium]|nr:RNA methyltransferase [Anaerolineales bacterium]